MGPCRDWQLSRHKAKKLQSVRWLSKGGSGHEHDE